MKKTSEAKLLSRVIFPKAIQPMSLDTFETLTPQRKVALHHKKKPIAYTSVRLGTSYPCDSVAEKRILRWIDSALKPIGMKVQSLAIEKSAKQHYYPDIQILLGDGRMVIGEVKALLDMIHFKTLENRKLLKRYAEAHGWGSFLMDPRGYSFEFLASDKVQRRQDLWEHIEKNIQAKGTYTYDDFNGGPWKASWKDRKTKEKYQRTLVHYALTHGYHLDQRFTEKGWKLIKD